MTLGPMSRDSSPLAKFFKLESSSSILLGISLLAALLLANWKVTQSTYFAALHFHVGMSIHEWINDGLMAVFFYLVGMEIKKELVSGSLSSKRKAMLPLFGAIGGMVVPALVFSLINRNPHASKAWGIPMATDIAFAVGALAVLRTAVPERLRAFLLALAVIDDLGAILVIACFYSAGVQPLWIAAFASVALLDGFVCRKGPWRWTPHVLLGAVAWFFMLRSGIHATLAGVVWGFLTPDDSSEHAPLDRAVDALHPYVNFLVLPIFSLANFGLIVPPLAEVPTLFENSVLWAIALGLLVGKPVGIGFSSWLCIQTGWGELPKGVAFKHLCGLGLIAGIGFTMALFIGQLSLKGDELLNVARFGILVGSVLSGILGMAALWLMRTRKADPGLNPR